MDVTVGIDATRGTGPDVAVIGMPPELKKLVDTDRGLYGRAYVQLVDGKPVHIPAKDVLVIFNDDGNPEAASIKSKIDEMMDTFNRHSNVSYPGPVAPPVGLAMNAPLDAGLTVDGQPLRVVLASDAATRDQTQDVLHAIAREFGWRTDWSTGSPITLQSIIDQIREMYAKPYNGPVHLYLTCPKCNARHIDLGDFAEGGTKSLHHTHSCQACGLTWRPAVNPTLGVEFLPGFKNG
jgi:hypothetical protein